MHGYIITSTTLNGQANIEDMTICGLINPRLGILYVVCFIDLAVFGAKVA